jgi:hypothetical protein
VEQFKLRVAYVMELDQGVLFHSQVAKEFVGQVVQCPLGLLVVAQVEMCACAVDLLRWGILDARQYALDHLQRRAAA